MKDASKRIKFYLSNTQFSADFPSMGSDAPTTFNELFAHLSAVLQYMPKVVERQKVYNDTVHSFIQKGWSRLSALLHVTGNIQISIRIDVAQYALETEKRRKEARKEKVFRKSKPNAIDFFV